MRQLFGLVVVTLFAAGCATTVGTSGRKQAGALSTQVESLDGRLAALEERLGRIEEGQTLLQRELEALESRQAAAPAGPKRAAGAKRVLSVRQIQQALAATGLYQGKVDGKEGPKTREAIRAFQKSRGLKSDGIVGEETTTALLPYLESKR